MGEGKIYLYLILIVCPLLIVVGLFFNVISLSLFTLFMFPILLVIYFVTKDENKGNLPENIDSYTLVWKDSLVSNHRPLKDFKFRSCTIYKEGIGYLDYFAKYSEIKRITRKGNINPLSRISKFMLSFFPIGWGLSMGSGFKLAKLASKSFNIPEPQLDSLKIITKNKIIIFQVGDFEKFKENLKKLGQGHLLDESTNTNKTKRMF